MASYIRDTIRTYDAVASRYLEIRRDGSFETDWLRSFVDYLPVGSTVLDLGSGPGRDAAELRRQGVNPICLDRSIGMLRTGEREYPNPRILGDMLRLPLRDSSVAGVWANASLLHLSPEGLERGLSEISRVLAPKGSLYVSVKEGAGAEWETKRYGERRWFQYWSGLDLDRTVEAAGFGIARSGNEKTSANSWLVRLCVAAT
jgi:ubiquinone/menaquinone biosynthesis C-methylase UbiE